MKRSKLSICHYPTTTLLVDDNEEFLNKISSFLLKQKLACRFYSDARHALEFLNKQYKANPFTKRCVSTEEDRDLDTVVTYFDYRKIHHEIYNPDRHKQLSVIVADYAMPEMDGLTVCKQINDDYLLKLILTAEAGPGLAVQAFNEDIIQKFLEKGAYDLPDLLLNSLRDLQKKYFLQLSEMALNTVANDPTAQTPSCLSDAIFIKFFTDLCEKNQIIEYYLLDEHGSFLLLDIHANPSWLVVKSDQEMQNLFEYAHDEEISGDIITYLKTRKMVPYFHTEEDLSTPLEKAHRFFHPASMIKGDQNYYYAYLTDPNAYALERDKIISYANYLEDFSKSRTN